MYEIIYINSLYFFISYSDVRIYKIMIIYTIQYTLTDWTILVHYKVFASGMLVATDIDWLVCAMMKL